MRSDLFEKHRCKVCGNTDTKKFTRLLFQDGEVICKCLICKTMFILTYSKQMEGNKC
jgi:hypothetical protein